MGGFDDDEVDYVEDIKDDQSGGDDGDDKGGNDDNFAVLVDIQSFWTPSIKHRWKAVGLISYLAKCRTNNCYMIDCKCLLQKI